MLFGSLSNAGIKHYRHSRERTIMTPLHVVKEGTKVRIVQIDAGRGMITQLNHMGLFENDIITIVRNAHGHLIVAKDNLRLALGRGKSFKIFVEQVEE